MSALVIGGWAVGQLWLFWVAPVVGAAIAGVAYRALAGAPEVVEKAIAARVGR